MNEKILKYALENPHSFTIEINELKMDKETRIIPMTFFKPYIVTKWWGNLKLLFKSKNVELKRWKQKQGAPFLKDHIMEDQRGIILNGYLDKEGTLGGDVKFSRNSPGEELMTDIVDGIRPYSSVGFDIKKIKEMSVDDMTDEEKDIAITTQMPVYEIELWEPLEGSSVYSGAIPTVGAFGYDYYDLKKKEEIIKFLNEFNLPIKFEQQLNLNSNIKTKDTKMEKTPEQLAEETRLANEKAAIKLKEESRLKEEQRVTAIDALAKDYKDKVKVVNLDDHANLYKRTGKSAEAFGNFIVEKIEKQSQEAIAQGHVNVTMKNLSEYNVARAFQSAKDGSKCFERDVSEQASKQLGVNARGIVIPENVLVMKKMSLMSARELKHLGLTLFDLTVGGALTGAELVGLTHLVSEFIGVLYNRTLAFQLGVRRLPNQVGSISIPKMTSGATYGFAATETGNFAESTPGTAELNLSPHRGGTYVDVSTQSLVQMQPAIAGLVLDDLMMAVELGIDLAYFHGTGASGQPTGLALTSGIGSFGGPSIDWAGIVEAETDIEVANADIGTMAFATTPAVKAALKTRPILANISGPIWQPDNSVNGYGAFISNQITAGYAFFGVYSQSVVPMWGATEVIYDDKSLRVGGLVRFLIENFIDVGIRRAGCYTLATGVN